MRSCWGTKRTLEQASAVPLATRKTSALSTGHWREVANAYLRKSWTPFDIRQNQTSTEHQTHSDLKLLRRNHSLGVEFILINASDIVSSEDELFWESGGVCRSNLAPLVNWGKESKSSHWAVGPNGTIIITRANILFSTGSRLQNGNYRNYRPSEQLPNFLIDKQRQTIKGLIAWLHLRFKMIIAISEAENIQHCHCGNSTPTRMPFRYSEVALSSAKLHHCNEGFVKWLPRFLAQDTT